MKKDSHVKTPIETFNQTVWEEEKDQELEQKLIFKTSLILLSFMLWRKK